MGPAQRAIFGTVSVPGGAERHPRVLVVVDDDDELMALLGALAAQGLVASGLSDPALARAVVARSRFEVVLADRDLAPRFWSPLLAEIACARCRLVLLAPPGEPAASPVEGVRAIARPLLLPQIMGAIAEAIASSPRLAETQPQLPAA